MEFRRAFTDYGREDNFSYEGLNALYNYIVEVEEDCGSEIELDVIALCCEYEEYAGLEEFHADYDKETYPDIETLRDYTQVIEIDNSDSFIIACF